MLRIMRRLIEVIKSKPEKDPLSGKPNQETMETLWGMKDRAVTVNKCAGMAQLMFEGSSRFGELTGEQVQNLVVYVLDYVYVYGLMSLCRTFEDLSPELQELLYHVHDVTKIRSNWLELYTYRRGLVPGAVDTVHREYAKERAEWKGVVKSLEAGAKEAGSPETEYTRLHRAAEAFRRLSVWGHGLESTLDDLYAKCVRGYVEP
jgi:hypothetical protein